MDLQPQPNTVEPFDQFFYRFAIQVFKHLSDSKPLVDRKLKNSHLTQLSLMTAGYVSDLVTETGVWSAYLRHHEQETGRPLPFFERVVTDDYDEFVPDICVIFWTYLQSDEATYQPSFPNDHQFITVAQSLQPLLIEAFETAPETKRYERFLTFPDPSVQPDLIRNVTSWLTEGSWLFGWEGGQALIDAAEKLVEDAQKKDPDWNQKLMSVLMPLQARQSFEYRSSFGGVHTWDIAAEILIAPDSVKAKVAEVANNTHLPLSSFNLGEISGGYRDFTDTQTGLTYRVNCSTIPPALTPEFRSVTSTLMKYDGEWYATGGGFSESPMRPSKKTNHIPFPLATPEEQTILRERLAEQEAAFSRLFGGEIVIIPTQKDLESFQQRFIQFINEGQTDTAEAELIRSPLPITAPLSDLTEEAMLYVFHQGVGTIIEPNAVEVIVLVDSLKNGEANLRRILNPLVQIAHPVSVKATISARLAPVVEKGKIEEYLKYLDYLGRVYQPKEYAPALPQMAAMR